MLLKNYFLGFVRFVSVVMGLTFVTNTALAYIITLQGNGATTAGTTQIYADSTGVYLDSGLSQKMTTTSNGITVPSRSGYTFMGFYTAEEGGSLVVYSSGKITQTGITTGKNLTSNTTWYARWRKTNCTAGKYWSASAGACQTCPVGSYCPSTTPVYSYNEDEDLGRISCGGVSYTSGAGAKSITQCYSLLLGTYSCSTLNPISAQAHIVSATYVNETVPQARRYLEADGTESSVVSAEAGACDITGVNCETGYHQGTTGYSSVLTPIYNGGSSGDLSTGYSNYTAVTADGNVFGSTNSYKVRGNLPDGEFRVGFSYGDVYGRSLCSTTVGSAGGTEANPDTTPGNYCWCKIKKFAQSGTIYPLTSTWVRHRDSYSSADACESNCAYYCANTVLGVSSEGSSGAPYRNVLYATENHTQYTCTVNTFSVAYDANGGSGNAPTSPKTCTYGGTCNAPTNTYTRTGYTFGGWSCTASTGSCASSTYAAGASISTATTVDGATITLKPIWTPNQYTVTLNANNGTIPSGGTTSVTATYNATMPTIVTTKLPTRTGYTFAGYYDTSAATGGTQYYTAAGASARTWNKTTATTLYARWTPNTINIVWQGVASDAKFGTTDAVVDAQGRAESSVSYGGDIITPSKVATKTGMTFLGWRFSKTQS